MKKETEIYAEYIKYNPNKPMLIGKENHWKTYYEGYEMGYQDAIEERDQSWHKELGIDLEKFPLEVNEQFSVMRKALQEYYQIKSSDPHSSAH